MKRKLVLYTVFTILYGCGQPVGTGDKGPSFSEVFSGTVGSVCELTGYSRIRVQGYSLVWGLPGTGSSECPVSVKKYLIGRLRRAETRGFLGPGYVGLTSEEVLADHRTAVVLVSGWIPAGAPRGTRFDVEVVALSATQTTSLEGGQLLATDMQRVILGRTGRVVTSRPVAAAIGPIFVNPFALTATEGPAVQADARRGIVIGGGRSFRDRNIQLTTGGTSYRLAQQIQNRISSRFFEAQGGKVADALSRNVIKLRIPKAYYGRHNHFVSLCLSLYLDDRPGALETKLISLNHLAEQPGAELEAISLAWEGIGRNSLSHLKRVYRENNGALSFYAARTALNLGDRGAIEVLSRIALDGEHSNQTMAIRELMRATDDRMARKALTKLLETENVSHRILAYKGLRSIEGGPIQSEKLRSGLWLDRVPYGKDMVCVWAEDSPRIVLFGRDVSCLSNVYFETANKEITVSGKGNEKLLTIIRQFSGQGQFVSCKSTRLVSDLVRKLAEPVRPPNRQTARGGAGLNFSQIAGLLYEMCQEKHQVIDARFKLHRL